MVVVGFGVVGLDMERQAAPRSALVWSGTAGSGWVRLSLARSGAFGLGKERQGMAWQGMSA